MASWFISSFSALLEAAAALLMALSGVRASQVMFTKLVHNLLCQSMSFFDTTPLGRVTNLVSSETETLDLIVPFTFRSMLNLVMLLVTTLGFIVVSMPLFLAVLPLLAVIFYFMQVITSFINPSLPEYP